MNKLTEKYQTFYNHVFGDGQYYYHNGIYGKLFINLNELEKRKAKDLVYKALADNSADIRPIIASGHLKLNKAIPLLQKKLQNRVLDNKMREEINIAIMRIKITKRQIPKLISIANSISEDNNISRGEALWQLSTFNNENIVITTFQKLLFEYDQNVGNTAALHIRSKYNNDKEIDKLVMKYVEATTREKRDNLGNKIIKISSKYLE
jgi:hypothetical protein